MDAFVCKKLTEWDLSVLIDHFKDQGIDKESLYCLDKDDIAALIPQVGQRSKFKKHLKNLKQQETATVMVQGPDPNAERQALPSTSNTSHTEKRRSDHQSEPSKLSSSVKRPRGPLWGRNSAEDEKLSKVKKIMDCVNNKLDVQVQTKLTAFLKNKISDLKTDKRKLVGVFGKTGAGKSSLINAVIGEKNLLPCGSVKACTTVMIKVEANLNNNSYEADIEFISKEAWKDELWSLLNFAGHNSDEESDNVEDIDDEKLSALYGEEWKGKSIEKLLDIKFKEIPEFGQSGKKNLAFESAAELSAQLVKYTRNDKEKKGQAVRRQYWPLVKCVTIRVPNNDLLKHVTLVDLPGNGDCNKSRDEMWKTFVGCCSAVWIVTDTNRAASEKEPWEILDNTVSLIGNGGECQRIHFICTKSDQIDDSDELGTHEVREIVFERNRDAKDEVREKFKKQDKIKKYFSGDNDSLQVFTVSSKEFWKKKCLNPDETEIPELQKFLQTVNDRHSEALNYVSGAYGILSLMLGASHAETASKKADVCKVLEEKLNHELVEVHKEIRKACVAFEICLSEGAEKSQKWCEGAVRSFLYRRDGRGFHKTLKSVVENNGVYKPPKKKELNLNVKLASHMTDSIDEQFKKTFPNEGKHGPFNGIISKFSLDTKRLADDYKDVELQLIFLNTEEEKLKAKVNTLIRKQKKKIYACLPEAIEESMQECYAKAAGFRGQDTLRNMRETIENHVRDSKLTMFVNTMDVMMMMLKKLKETILNTMTTEMQKSMEASLKMDDTSIPDVTSDYEIVKKCFEELKESFQHETTTLVI